MTRNRLIGGLSCVLLAHAASASADAEYDLSGFLDYVYTGVNDLVPNQESKFDGNAEMDMKAKAMGGKVAGRVDVDFFLSNSNRDSADLEQAFAQWNITDRMGLDVGAVNSGIGWEKEDAIDLLQTSHGQIYDFFDSQTALAGNNVEGALFRAIIGKVNTRVGFLNDLGDSSGHNSILVQAASDIINGFNVQGSFVTQHAQAGNMLDVNSTYRRGPLIVAVELMTAEQTVDYGWGGMGHFDFGNRYGVTGRIDHVDYSKSTFNAITSYTVAGIWDAMENFQLYLEYRGDDNGTWNNRLTLEALARFL